MLRGGRVDTMELYFESAMIVTLISLGKYLERRSYRKTNAAVKGLVIDSTRKPWSGMTGGTGPCPE